MALRKPKLTAKQFSIFLRNQRISRTAGAPVPANSPSVSARVLIEKLLEEDDRQRASYKDCVGSEVMHLYVSAKWILADNRFVYEIIP